MATLYMWDLSEPDYDGLRLHYSDGACAKIEEDERVPDPSIVFIEVDDNWDDMGE